MAKESQHSYVAAFRPAAAGGDDDNDTSSLLDESSGSIAHYVRTAEVYSAAAGDGSGGDSGAPPLIAALGSLLVDGGSGELKVALGGGEATMRTFTGAFVAELSALVARTRGRRLGRSDICSELPAALVEFTNVDGFDRLYRSILVAYHLSAE